MVPLPFLREGGWISHEDIMAALKNMLTGKDNQTHDIIRVAIAIVGLLFPAMIVWGLAMETWAFAAGKSFDLEAPYRGIAFLITAFGLFLGGSAGAIYWKRVTEPDGTKVESESIEKSANTNS
jgi:hypothetical protein